MLSGDRGNGLPIIRSGISRPSDDKPTLSILIYSDDFFKAVYELNYITVFRGRFII